MASWSAFGFGGYDPIASYFEGQQNLSFNKDMAKYNSALQYEYAQRYAENNPSWQRKGLENAGYNPLLAISSGVASPFGGNVDGSISHAFGDGTSASFDASAFARNKYALRAEKAETEAIEAESDATQAASAYEAELDRLRLDALRDMDSYDADSPTRLDFKQAFKNGIQRDRYVNSREHAVAEDAVNAIHGGSSAFSNIAHGMRALRERQSRRRR